MSSGGSPKQHDIDEKHKSLNLDHNGTHETIAMSCYEEEPPLITIPVPPDGGYGWVIAFSGFMLSFVLDGVCFSFGLYMEEFMDYFGATNAQTAWIGSVLNGMYLTIGPVVSALCNRFGCRRIAVTGSIIAGVSLMVSIFSPNVEVVILTFGFLGGLGFGMLYLPAIVMVGFYFEKRRALATGFCVCGSGIGGLVFAPLTRYLIAEFGWKGSVLITSGLVFNCIVMSALLRPLKAVAKIKPPCPLKNERNSSLNQSNQNENSLPTKTAPETNSNSINQTANSNKNPSWFRSLGNMNLNGQHLNKSTENGQIEQIQMTSNGNQLSHRKPVDLGRSCDLNFLHNSSVNHISSQNQLTIDVSRPMFRKDTFYVSNAGISDVNKSSGHLHADDGLINRYSCSIRSGDELHTSMMGLGSDHKSVSQSCGSMFDVSLLTSPSFLIYGACCFLSMLGFFIPFTFVPVLATSKGFSREDGALLISVMSAVNVIGRILIGWVSDQVWANPIYINSGALILGGLATAFYPYYDNFGLLLLASSIFGLSIATFVSLRSIIMVKLMGLPRLSSAFGMVTLCQGLSSFIGSPLAGALCDASGTFVNSFYLAGAAMCMAGLVTLPLTWVNVREQAMKKDTN